MPQADLAALERGLRRGEKRVAPHRDRRRSGMRRLSGEADHVALDAEGAEHDAGGLLHRLEHRPLLDVQLEIRAARRSASARPARRASDRARRRSPRAHPRAACPGDPSARAHRRSSGSPAAAAEPSRLRPKRAPFFVGPVDEPQRHRRRRARVHPQRLEPGDDAEAAVEPAAIGHRIEMAADDHRLRRRAGQRHPVVARPNRSRRSGRSRRSCP